MITGYEEVEEEPPGGGAGSDKAGSER